MIAPLPKPIEDLASTDPVALAQRVYRWARQVDEHLRLQPTVELLTLEIDPATLPLTVLIETEDVLGVARIGTRNLTTNALVSDVTVSARVSNDPNAPGLTVEALGGTSNGTQYAVTLAVLGRRG